MAPLQKAAQASQKLPDKPNRELNRPLANSKRRLLNNKKKIDRKTEITPLSYITNVKRWR